MKTDVGGIVIVEGVRSSTAVDSPGFARPVSDVPELCAAIKGSGCFPGFLRRCGAHPSSPLDPPLTSETSGLVLLLSVLSHGIPSQIKVILTFLVVRALSVNALSAPVARKPVPEPGATPGNI